MALRCGLVGTGSWAQMALLPALRLQPDIEVVGCVAGSIDEASRFAADEQAGSAFGSLEQMLDAPERPDFVVIATPDHVHAPAIEASLRRGVAAYCEKPLANDFATAAALARLGDETGILATVGYSFRFNPALQALKEDVLSGRLGEPWLIELAEHNPQFHPHGGKRMNWKGDPDQASGGALFEYGSHVVDLATWLIGPITRVSSSLQRVLPGARLDDIATVQMEFASGARGLLVASWLLTGGFPGIRIRLHGSEALAEVWVDDRLPGGQRYVLSSAYGTETSTRAVQPMGDVRTDAPQRHLAAFAARLRGNSAACGEALPTLEQGARVQAVLEAVLQATDAWQAVANY